MPKLLYSKKIGYGKPLLILHGLFGMSDNWHSLAKEFGEFFETHIVDQRNHGKSFHSPIHSYKTMCKDLLYYIDFYGFHKVTLLGHSMGGKTAMLFATIYPSRIEKIVIVDIAPKYYHPPHEIFAGLKAVEIANVQSRKQADDILKLYFSEISIRQFLLKNLYWKNKQDLSFRFNLKTLQREIDNIGESLPPDSKFIGRSLFVSGQNSDYINFEDEELIEKHFPDMELIEVPDAGHWIHAENSSYFFDKVIRFLIYS